MAGDSPCPLPTSLLLEVAERMEPREHREAFSLNPASQMEAREAAGGPSLSQPLQSRTGVETPIEAEDAFDARAPHHRGMEGVPG